MPVYEYLCDSCGPFEALAPMSKFADPCDCPDCAATAPRIMITAPHVSGVSSSTRHAHETNERAADSPKKLSSHGPGCGCCSGGHKKKSKTLYRPDGSKSFPTKRPWMISH
ncbi:MAG: zinc ribbon domain-containing protein [Pseudomonadota bacterium]|jgi:putative FmdB family regulatory protein|nr:zinc ribbon domain-containing protein [Pseudomonadota bacterium]MEC8795125.1 zinc ribbon domain-containing protein [Pseudomonadota bacterium]